MKSHRLLWPLVILFFLISLPLLPIIFPVIIFFGLIWGIAYFFGMLTCGPGEWLSRFAHNKGASSGDFIPPYHNYDFLYQEDRDTNGHEEWRDMYQ